MICVKVVAKYQRTTTAASVDPPTASREGSRQPLRMRAKASVATVGELLELRIGIDHAHVFVGHVARRLRRFRKRAGALHEFGNLVHPLVDIGSLAALHDFQLSGKIEGRTGV